MKTPLNVAIDMCQNKDFSQEYLLHNSRQIGHDLCHGHNMIIDRWFVAGIVKDALHALENNQLIEVKLQLERILEVVGD